MNKINSIEQLNNSLIQYNAYGMQLSTMNMTSRLGYIPAFHLLSYGTRQKECNKRAAAAMISATYSAPLILPCVPHFLKVRRLVKH